MFIVFPFIALYIYKERKSLVTVIGLALLLLTLLGLGSLMLGLILVTPMLAHASEIRHTLALIDFARAELDNKGLPYGPIKLGAMIEVPAAALMLGTFLKYFDFLSIGTNDLIQYTLAIDRADESVAHLYDPWHPAVLKLISSTIEAARAAGKPASRRAIGNCSPITPVENGNTAAGLTCVSSARAAQLRLALAIPGAPVPALALPVLITR